MKLFFCQLQIEYGFSAFKEHFCEIYIHEERKGPCQTFLGFILISSINFLQISDTNRDTDGVDFPSVMQEIQA